MEMESSRRPPFDNRSRELGLKRQRIAEEPNLPARSFPSQRPPNSSAAASSRLRPNDRDRESDDSVRGPYQQQPPQQHRELVAQYKTALSELTFNSKPIITNLTIIAGENSHAAKAISATICAHILEVPSDQKLPSLYLLDSIVKNIGRDYVKHFAPRLPEIFIKAYRQVDPSIHPGMRHLFGTWKGVFPLQPLQLIEKELGLSPAVNGSSSGSTMSRADSQSQRQSHSIHVNPKYLEARQRLQQSNKPKGSASDGGAFVNPSDVERPGQVTSAGAEGSWRDTPFKMQNNQRAQREELTETLVEKLPNAEPEDYEYNSGISRQLSSRLGKVNERFTKQVYNKQWFGASEGMEESVTSQMNGYSSRINITTPHASRSSIHLPFAEEVPRSGRESARSWKNSDEEEFSWDDLNPRLVDHAVADSTRNDHWAIGDLDKLEFGRQSQPEIGTRNDREIASDSFLDEHREQVSSGPRISSMLTLHDPSLPHSSGLSHSKLSFQSQRDPSQATASSFGCSTTTVSGSVGFRHHNLSSGKPFISQHLSTSSFSARDPRLMLAEKDNVQSKAPAIRKTSFGEPLDLGSHKQNVKDLIPDVHRTLPLDNLKNLESQTLKKSTSTAPFKSMHLVSPPHLPPIPSEAGSQMQTSTSSLLAAVMKSGILPGLGSSSLVTDPSQSTLPGLGSGPSSSSTLHADPKLQGSALPPSGVSSVPSSSRSQSSFATSVNSNPFSSLLNTLVAKGLLSTSNSESQKPPSELSQKPHSASPVLATAVTEIEARTVSDCPPAFPASTTGRLASAKPAGLIPVKAVQLDKKEIDSLIGFEFRSNVLREFHPRVVDALFDDLPHCCSLCGLHLKLKERFDRHMEWHNKKNVERDSSNVPSRRWYSNSEDWIAGKVGLPVCCCMASSLPESSDTSGEVRKHVVLADESQCVCLLCGELFEDFYSQEKDEWMFKGALYMKIPSECSGKQSAGETRGLGLLVHEKCISDDSARELGLDNCVKLEKAE